MADDGVMRRSEQDRRAEVVAWRASGKSLGEFARQRGYSRSALEKWARSEASEAAPGFVRLEVARVADSCGYGVPLMDFRAPRRDGAAWLAKSSDQTLRRYLVANNQRSLDGLPAMSADELEGVVIRRDR